MDDIQAITSLAQALETAADAENWQQVQKVDQQIAGLLSELARRSSLDSTTREALAGLRLIHQRVNQLCCQKSEELEQKMALQRRNKEGVAAYSLFSDEEDNH